MTNELNELRSLLFGLEPQELEKIYARLDNPKITAEDLSRLLPEAAQRAEDKELSDAMVPTVEHAIHASVQKDQDVLATAIFPIVGPATRKAAIAVVEEMIQSLDNTLEFGLSPKSLKWRIEAIVTGKTFAQIVLLRTLVYRVEQVFLIHKKNGLLLQHIVALQVAIQDPDLVSAMLTAIQDFAKDSFNTNKEDALHSLYFGELTIWIEEGPHAVLAGIIRGNAPRELKLVFQDAIEKIHQRLNRELIAFDGDTEPFADSKPFLQSCLTSQFKDRGKKNSPYALSLLGAIGLSIAIWGFFVIRNQMRWYAFLENLDSQAGIVVIKAETRSGKYFISGMRDSLSVEPNMLMKQFDFTSKEVISRWERYLSFEPQIIEKRAAKFFKAPTTVSFQVDENGTLNASGSAPRNWILDARKIWHFIPGVTQYQDKNLIEFELSQLEMYKKQIEGKRLLFVEGTTELLAGEEKKLQELVVKIQNISVIAQYLGKKIRIQIVGHTDSTGSEQRNIVLSQSRASTILNSLSARGINTSYFYTIGVGDRQPPNIESKEKDAKSKRRVSFKVFLSGTTR
ncbi:flagellar motor protein MotB [Scytonema hofmannii PCC 7110]|uniref:Flagellar motor protein MotB n=1 Tax=Scytonema hofmannii PCC 7110 TaxID=128403 RepID=A0A139WSC6_9CYAN|nr:OmpA family protein [Scytonema hofmannii]KYC35323.1 flagellar motor protein MotB [Scytonema hofmannii PCC 7110]